MNQPTILPLVRCPGCSRAFDTHLWVDVPFSVVSPYWRDTVADSFPVCLDCHAKMTAARQDQWEFRAVYGFWAMNRDLEAFRASPDCSELFSVESVQ